MTKEGVMKYFSDKGQDKCNISVFGGQALLAAKAGILMFLIYRSSG
jgi:hypothetical protein